MFYVPCCNAPCAVAEICLPQTSWFYIHHNVSHSSITLLLLITFVSHVTSSSAPQENAHHQLQSEHYVLEQQFLENKCTFGPDYYFLISWWFILSISSTFCFFFPFSAEIILIKFFTIPLWNYPKSCLNWSHEAIIRFGERQSELPVYAFCTFSMFFALLFSYGSIMALPVWAAWIGEQVKSLRVDVWVPAAASGAACSSGAVLIIHLEITYNNNYCTSTVCSQLSNLLQFI